jgi:hypothetical protein
LWTGVATADGLAGDEASDRQPHTDVVVCAGPLDQATRTLTDAVAIFEVLSDDPATIDRVDKLIDYAEVASLRSYVLR